MNQFESSKKEILSIFKGCKEKSFLGTPVLRNTKNQHLILEYQDLSAEEVEKWFIDLNWDFKNDSLIYNREDGFRQTYTIPTFYSKCSKKFGKETAKILTNLFFIHRNLFNRFHWGFLWGYKCSGILNLDIIVPKKSVNAVTKAFNLIFDYRNGGNENLRIIQFNGGAVFEMDIVSAYHYLSTKMFIYKTKLLTEKDFIKEKDNTRHFGKWQPECIDNPKLNRMHPDSELWK